MGVNSKVTLWPQIMTPSILQSEKIQILTDFGVI